MRNGQQIGFITPDGSYTYNYSEGNTKQDLISHGEPI